jgi:hypothetical protein
LTRDARAARCASGVPNAIEPALARFRYRCAGCSQVKPIPPRSCTHSCAATKPGAEQILRARADAGDWHSARELAERLAQRGDLDGLRAVQNRMYGVRCASGGDATSSVP